MRDKQELSMTQVKAARRGPSPEEVQAEQKRQAAADLARKNAMASHQAPLPEREFTPVNSTTAVVPAQSTALSTDTRTATQAWADEAAPSTMVGRLVGFNKGGKFAFKDDDSEISPNTDHIALTDEVQVGWIKFNGDGEPPTRITGLLSDGFRMPARDTLGDLDEAQWPTGLSGRPEDPWKSQAALPLQNAATKEMITFVTTSTTGRRAVGNLLRHYDRMKRTNPHDVPVVRLKPSGFNHRDDRIGWVATPSFVVVGKAPRDSAAVPDTSIEADMNDKLPF
jgi:hypothetical protein